MKKNLHYLLLSLILVHGISCSKKPTLPGNPPGQREAYIKDTGQLVFKVIPQSATEVKLLFIFPQGRNLVKLLLKKDTTILGTYTVNNDLNNHYSVDIPYNFDSTLQYNFTLRTDAVNDTIYQYSIPHYTHIFKSAYAYRKILNLTQSLGPGGFDITPSHNYIFIADDSVNTIITKKMSLRDYSVENISTQLYPLPMRAVSDSSLLIQGVFFMNPVPAHDSVSLAKYNTITGKTEFIDWVSSGYGRTSRIIDNHVLVTNPIFTSKTSSLIDLADLGKIKYSAAAVNFTRISEDNFDNIYNGNLLVDPATGNFTSLLPASSNEAVAYHDNINSLTIATAYTLLDSGKYSSHLSVYSNQNKIYQLPEIVGRGFYIPAIQNIKNNTILFYQKFDYGTQFNIDGYYTLDLNTGKVMLIDSDAYSSPYMIDDLQLDGKRILSVRYDGIYELLRK